VEEREIVTRTQFPKVSVMYNHLEGKLEQEIWLSNSQKRSRTTAYFLFSGMAQDLVIQYSKIISKLDVVVLESWDNSCTHLICSKISPTEKFLCACASGIWYNYILSKGS
jgi:hypothetical protein